MRAAAAGCPDDVVVLLSREGSADGDAPGKGLLPASGCWFIPAMHSRANMTPWPMHPILRGVQWGGACLGALHAPLHAGFRQKPLVPPFQARGHRGNLACLSRAIELIKKLFTCPNRMKAEVALARR